MPEKHEEIYTVTFLLVIIYLKDSIRLNKFTV